MAHEAAHAVEHALALSGSMTWEILWALILGFTLSAVVQAVVRRSTIVALLGDDRPRTLVVAAGLGAASSSCSYAAVALARSLFRKGANFTAAMAFEIGSTNLVVELGIILALLMGWQFTAAEFIGGPLMIVALAVLFRLFVRTRLVDAARRQADRGLAGSMEGHAAMDMSVQREGSFWQRLLSREGFTSVAHVFVMEWAAILRDLVVGLLIAGSIAAWVPESFWQHFFFADHPVLSTLWGPIVGPIVATGRSAVERRHQLWWRCRVHLRRPAHPADPEHLPEVLRHQDDADVAGHLLCRHGHGRLYRRIVVRRSRPHPVTAQRHGDGSRHLLELHHLAEHRLPRAGSGARRPVRQDRRCPDAPRHGRLPRRRKRPQPPQPLTAVWLGRQRQAGLRLIVCRIHRDKNQPR
jgi:uncharacterized membrane protein YraQ (UPF0718 family)